MLTYGEVVSPLTLRASGDTLLLTFHFFSVYFSKIFLYFHRHTYDLTHTVTRSALSYP